MDILATISPAIKPAGSPLVAIAGAYFPAWLAAVLGGMVLATLLRWVLARLLLADVLEPGPVMVPVLFVACSCFVWLAFFSAG